MQPEIRVHPTDAEAARAAARRFVTAAAAAIHARGEFIVALSGGATPRALYALLAVDPDTRAVDWSRVQVLWGDERCVPPDHPESNYRMAREALLDHVPVPPGNVHRIRGEVDPSAAASEYERVLRRLLRTPTGPASDAPGARIDLVLLGLGVDGHTASLFPGAAVLLSTPLWVRSAFAHAVSAWRVTLTPVVLNAAAEVAFLVTGTAKAAVVRQVLAGPHRPGDLPAQVIAPTAGRVTWFLDALAAAELTAEGRAVGDRLRQGTDQPAG